MQLFIAQYVGVPDDVDLSHGEGSIQFGLLDPTYGEERLEIELDGFCSRQMPVRSGYGVQNLTLHRDRLVIEFTPALAQKLELADRVDIELCIDDEEFRRLSAFIEMIAY